VLFCGSGGDPSRLPFEGLVHRFTHGGSFTHATHRGLHTAAMTAAAAARSTAVASSAAVAAVAVGEVAITAAALTMQQGRAWGVRAACAATLVATAAWISLVGAAADTATLLISSLPRTIRAARWAVRAALAYSRFAAQHAGLDPDSDAYQDALGELHTRIAAQLLDVCRANGGVYIKAGQFAACFGAVPREYRLVLAGLEDRATPRPFEAIRDAVDRELAAHGGMALFAQFDSTATAAASLAQVGIFQGILGGWLLWHFLVTVHSLVASCQHVQTLAANHSYSSGFRPQCRCTLRS
jgi:aarF domain-containing kinase